MSIIMPPLKQVISPNYSARASGSTIRLIVVHMMEGSYAGSIAWFATSKSQVSAHLLMKADGSEWTQMVPLNEKAWHACNANSYSIGIEGEGYTAKGFDAEWSKSMALGVAWLLHAYGLPCRWAHNGAGEGFCSHHDLGAAGGGHIDIGPCGGTLWQGFAEAVSSAYAALAGAPLPAWALHGAPAPLAISPAPAVAPEPSHNGALRADVPVAPAAPPAPAAPVVLPVWPTDPNDPFFAHARTVFSAWRALGVSVPFALAMVTQAEFESAFKTDVVGDHGAAFNIYQWHEPRIAAMLAGCGVNVKTESDLTKVVGAAWWELNHTEIAAREAIAAATTASAASRAACTLFEGAGAADAAERRALGAERWSVYFAEHPL